MGLNDYHFVTEWVLDAPPAKIYDLLSAPEKYQEWITGFFVKVESIKSGNADGIGKTDRFTVKGGLPYSLSWELRCIEAKKPDYFTSIASGDLEGRGTWIFTAQGPKTKVTFDWKITVRKPSLRRTAFLFRPLYELNHDWIMSRWKKDLQNALLK
jgi:uncharacterized protein YndB with AHSA1/START domain